MVTSEKDGPTIFVRIADVFLLGKDVVVIESSCFFFNLRISQPLGGDYTADFFSFGCLQWLISRLIVKNTSDYIRCCYMQIEFQVFSPLKINMEHNHGGLEDNFPF